MRALAFTAFAAMVFTASACASGGSSDSSSTSRDRDLITQQELEEVGRGFMYDAIQRLRPRWLDNRRSGIGGAQEGPRIYLDGQYWGDVDQLRTFDITGVIEVRYLNANDATTRFGTGHLAGAILIVTRRE